MKPRSIGAACTAALLACMAMLAQAGQTARDQELLDREMALAAQLRCVVCQNQTVAESRAPWPRTCATRSATNSSRAIAMSR